MLKKFTLGKKEIPVPVPVKNMEAAIDWVMATFVKNDEVITKICLNDKEITDLNPDKLRKITLNASSNLYILKENPQEISIQTLDAVRDLAHHIQKDIKFVVLKTWSNPSKEETQEITRIHSDVQLMLGLINQLNGILNRSHHLLAPINGLKILINKYQKDLLATIVAEDWQRSASVLITRYEDLLKELAVESENLQLIIYANGLQEIQNPLIFEK